MDRQKVRCSPSCFSIPHSLLQKAALQYLDYDADHVLHTMGLRHLD